MCEMKWIVLCVVSFSILFVLNERNFSENHDSEMRNDGTNEAQIFTNLIYS